MTEKPKTLLAQRFSEAIAANKAKPDEERESQFALVERVHDEFIAQHGQEAFDVQVVQPGGGLHFLGIAMSMDVIVRNQVRILRHLGWAGLGEESSG